MFDRIRDFIQRGRRGWADSDVWSVDEYLCRILPPMLRKIKEGNVGCPCSLYDRKAKNNECHKWEEILEEMAQGFEAHDSMTQGFGCNEWKKHKSGSGMIMTYDKKKAKLLEEKYNRGMELFVKYFGALWD